MPSYKVIEIDIDRGLFIVEYTGNLPTEKVVLNIGIPENATPADLEPHIFKFWPDETLKKSERIIGKGNAHRQSVMGFLNAHKTYTQQQVDALLVVNQFVTPPPGPPAGPP